MSIKEARRLKGITQTELARRIGTNQKVVSRYETGKQIPSLKRAEQIAQALSVRLDKLTI
jgi:transcriptional regulator with XRE-family HTH domain